MGRVNGCPKAGSSAGAASARSVASAGLVLAVFLGWAVTARAQNAGAAPSPPIAGVSLVAPRRPVDPDRLAPVRELGAGWVAVVPYAFVRRGSGRVVFGRDGQFWGEREDGIRAQVAAARDQGLGVLLKPHLWTRGGVWIGDWVPDDEAGWTTFEESYRAYVLGAARLAEELHVEILCVGTEMTRLVAERPDLFRNLVADVRAIYHGKLTYAANWDAYDRVPFWSELDYVGVDAYFPLARRPDATVARIERGWRPVLDGLARISREVGRPVLFTEYGYRSVAGAAGEQWSLPDVRRTDPARADFQAQARAYEAFFRSVWDRPWFAGGFLWKWYLEPLDGRRGERVAATGYTPQGKPAEKVVARWYRGADADGPEGRDRR